jgi:hypothetical protein
MLWLAAGVLLLATAALFIFHARSSVDTSFNGNARVSIALKTSASPPKFQN